MTQLKIPTHTIKTPLSISLKTFVSLANMSPRLLTIILRILEKETVDEAYKELKHRRILS